jgi:hypothetical protein
LFRRDAVTVVGVGGFERLDEAFDGGVMRVEVVVVKVAAVERADEETLQRDERNRFANVFLNDSAFVEEREGRNVGRREVELSKRGAVEPEERGGRAFGSVVGADGVVRFFRRVEVDGEERESTVVGVVSGGLLEFSKRASGERTGVRRVSMGIM